MVIYEVNLRVDQHIFADFYAWLIDHVKQMLTFPGFLRAEVAKECNEQALEQLTVRYHLKDRTALENYFTNHAPTMRALGLQKFGTNFQATRRIFENIVQFVANEAAAT